MPPTKTTELASTNAFEGPHDDEPLTEGELAILLAIPRAAANAPTATAFRIPLGIDPSMGWVDVTWSEARSIIARLAHTWTTLLSDLMINQPPIGPGTTICIFVQPSVQALFHIFTFWALRCTLQFLSLSLSDETIDLYLSRTGCRALVHSGISEAWVNTRRTTFSGVIVPLPEEEYAHRLAQAEKQGASQIFPWPEPRRPTPATILHSSATTGVAKFLHFSLYYYTLVLPTIPQTVRAAAPCSSGPAIKTPYTHPFLIFSPPYWQSFHRSLFSHLAADIPTAFAHIPDISKMPGSQLIEWIRGLDVGGVLCTPQFLHGILTSELEHYIFVLQNLYIIIVCGYAIDTSTSALVGKYKLRLVNMYGSSEIAGILYATQAPYTHLRIPAESPPLVTPIVNSQSDGSLQVQLWHSLSTSPQLAHLYAKGGVPLKFEPFPGPGPHEGEPAVNMGDIFELVRLPPGSGAEFAYVHLGRSDDFVKLSGGVGWIFNVTPYESRIRSLVCSCQPGWTVDGVQLFGTGLPCATLVIQLSGDAEGQERRTNFLEDLGNLVERANEEFKLGPGQRVHTRKRLLIITPDKVWGPESRYIQENRVRLSMTHKHTLQRWKNVQAFQAWCNRLDFSEP